MELLLTTLVGYAPQIYICGVVGVAFKVFASLYEDAYLPSFIDILGMLVYSLFVGSIWPGLLIAKVAL